MLIAFVHNGHALLPEIAAYRRFFTAMGIETTVCRYGSEHSAGADILWYFMGLFPKANSDRAIVIHEYSSASIPPFHRQKDLMKGILNPPPDYRIFHNEYVLKQVKPDDRVPFGFRDQGVDLPPQKLTADKTFDFVYSGSCSPERRLSPLLTCFATGAVKDRKLLLLGTGYKQLQRKFARHKNISFAGPVLPAEVPGYLARAKFAINYMPDILPFNVQTSTKMLDYAAAGLPVISSRYNWMLRFEEQFGGKYYYLDAGLGNLEWERINAFRYEWPDLRSWSWEQQIHGSGVLEFLGTKFREHFGNRVSHPLFL